MLYTVNKDKNGFILSIAHTPNDDTELDISMLDLKYLNAYQIIDGIISLNEERKIELEAEEERKEKDMEIEQLKANLSATDYVISETFEDIMSLDNTVTFIVDFIRIVKQFSQNYADILANRKAWRQRIKELEK